MHHLLVSYFPQNDRKKLAFFLIGYFCYRFLAFCQRQCRLKSAVQARKNEQILNFERITHFYEQLSENEANLILSWSYEKLKENLQNGRVSCVHALQAYQRKAMEVTKKTNCVCLFVEEAIHRAQVFDAKAKDPNFKKPPLFGLPISIKECVAIKDMDCTLGYVQDLFHPARDDSVAVKSVKELGAVPFVHTNNPLSLLTWGCTNAIYGTTTHPRDPSRIPGGSSGGEAALISSGGSVLGIGSDIGGSIRIPSAFCGLAGFKPTVARFSHINSPGGIPGRCKIIATEGPMSKDINNCIDFLRLAWRDDFLFETDPYVPPVHWNEDLFSSKEPLTIGFYKTDGYFLPAPAYIRAVEETIAFLKGKGHRLVEIAVPNSDQIFKFVLGSVSADGGYFLSNKLDKDLVPSEVNYGIMVRYVTPFFQKLIKPFVPWPRLRKLLGVMPSNMYEMREINAGIDSYRREFLKMLQEKGIDAIVCPSMVMYPPPPLIPVTIPPATSYTSLYNVLDYPAGVVPVTIVNSQDEKSLESYPEADPYDKLIKKSCRGMEGWPIGIQVVAKPFREEVALRILKEIQDGIGLKQ